MNRVVKPIRVLFFMLTMLLCAVYAGAADSVPAMPDQKPIPPGTLITTANWQQYKDYIPEGKQWLFSGKYFWHFAPNQGLLVGPAMPIHLPKAYLSDTEKFSSQVRLVDGPENTATISNYVAGIPFPRPSGPKAGLQVLYNVYYRFNPRMSGNLPDYTGVTYIEDGFKTLTRGQIALAYYQRLGHLSDPPYPRNIMDPFDQAQFIEVLGPEQAKYTNQLILYYQDPRKFYEVWAFTPSLRRVVRLSSAARCAPSVGTDQLGDDGRLGWNGITAYANADLIGHRRILTAFRLDPTKIPYYAPNTPIMPQVLEMGVPDNPPLTPPGWGKWEPREDYIIDVRMSPSYGAGYCYGRRDMYVDAETWTPAEYDLYDANLKPWKAAYPHLGLCKMPDGSGEYPSVANAEINCVVDIQNNHFSILDSPRCLTDGQMPERYLDLNKYAKPAGLARIMR